MELSDSETPVLEQTYRELRLPLLRLAFMLTGSRETAEDVVQSAFTSAQPRWHTIDDPPAYLRRSVVNLAKDGQRREFRRRLRQTPEPEPVTEIQELDETWALARNLPTTQRKVVVRHYYEDLSLVEIATLLARVGATTSSRCRPGPGRSRSTTSSVVRCCPRPAGRAPSTCCPSSDPER